MSAKKITPAKAKVVAPKASAKPTIKPKVAVKPVAKKAVKEVAKVKPTAKKEKKTVDKKGKKSTDDDDDDVVVKDDYYETEDEGGDDEPVIPKKSGKKKGKKGEETDDSAVEPEAFEVVDEILAVEIDDDEIEVKIKRGKKAPKKVARKIQDVHFEFDIIPPVSPDSKYIMFEMEFPIHSSLGVLYEFLIEPTALQEWFAERVQERNTVYTFFWQGSQQQAQLLKEKVETLVRYRWLDGPRDVFFEFRIIEDELTRDTSLIVIDYAEDAEEIAAARLLWKSQIDDLHRVLGAR